jgi:glycine oxidase
MRILVRGAGVAGLAMAFELVTRGVDVLVCEAGPRVGSGASWFAGGMLAPWCERESAEAAVVELGRLSADWWDAALPGLVQRHGTLVVAPPRDAAELGRFASRTDGFDRVDGDVIATLEPDLEGRFRQGLFFTEEAHLDPRAALSRLHGRLVEAGVRFLFDGEQPAAAFDHVIDCTGMAARNVLSALRGVRGELLYLETQDVRLSRPVRLLHPRIPLYVVPRGDGRFMVGATMIESDDRGPVTARSLMELLNAAYTLHPAFGEARVVETGAGVRPAFTDNLPSIERSGNAIYLNGFHRHGFLLAPAMAKRVADMIGKTETAHARDRERAIA